MYLHVPASQSRRWRDGAPLDYRVRSLVSARVLEGVRQVFVSDAIGFPQPDKHCGWQRDIPARFVTRSTGLGDAEAGPELLLVESAQFAIGADFVSGK